MFPMGLGVPAAGVEFASFEARVLGSSLWSVGEIAGRLEEAMMVVSRLPSTGQVIQRKVAWPVAPLRAPEEEYGHALERARVMMVAGLDSGSLWRPMRARAPLPDGAAVTRADEAIGWLWWLPVEERTVVMARASGARWGRICWRLGKSRRTLYRWWLRGLGTIAERLSKVQTQEGNR